MDQRGRTRNPFGVMDVPNPNDQEVLEFATRAKLAGTSDDENAKAWAALSDHDQYEAIEGNWSSRWNGGARRGLIDAHREGTRLVGKYINLTDPKVTRPWIGLIVSNRRIDGRWTGGRLDFRR